MTSEPNPPAPTLDRCAAAIAGVMGRYKVEKHKRHGQIVWCVWDKEECEFAWNGPLPTKERAQAWIDEQKARACIGAQWQPIETAPVDEWVILATTGGWQRQAIQYQDQNNDATYWVWATDSTGRVHPNNVPLGWQELPEPPALTAVLRGEA